MPYKMVVKIKGGPTSGNYGHAGRPGLVGGSGGEGYTSAGELAQYDQGMYKGKPTTHPGWIRRSQVDIEADQDPNLVHTPDYERHTEIERRTAAWLNTHREYAKDLSRDITQLGIGRINKPHNWPKDLEDWDRVRGRYWAIR